MAASSYSCTLMISGATKKPIAQEAWYSARNIAKNSMGSLRYSKIFMETVGT